MAEQGPAFIGIQAEKNLVTFNSIKNELLSKAKLSIARHITEANFIEMKEIDIQHKNKILKKS